MHGLRAIVVCVYQNDDRSKSIKNQSIFQFGKINFFNPLGDERRIQQNQKISNYVDPQTGIRLVSFFFNFHYFE